MQERNSKQRKKLFLAVFDEEMKKNCYLPLDFRVCHHSPSSNNSESNLILRPKTGNNICDGFVEADDK